MKYIYIHSSYSILNKNANIINMVGDVSIEDFLLTIRNLYIACKKNNITLLAGDFNLINKCDGILFVDYPNDDSLFEYAKINQIPVYLYVWESPIINKKNHDVLLLSKFKKIYTYNRNIIKKLHNAFELNYVIQKKNIRNIKPSKLICCVSGNRYSLNKNELYSERRNIIKILESSSLDFDLYGQGWDKFIPPQNIFQKVYNRFLFRYFPYKPYTSWKGEVMNKEDIICNYKYTICFENSLNNIGYISEKILSTICAGSIPIYLGCVNLSNYLSPDLFIDYSSFSSSSDLIDFLKCEQADISQKYKSARSKLLSGHYGIFSQDNFNNIFIKEFITL